MEMAVKSMETVVEAMESMETAPGGTSPSRQGAGTETSVPRNWSLMAAALRNFYWKTLIDLGFGVRRLYISGEAAS
jgi:hypothetical protein